MYNYVPYSGLFSEQKFLQERQKLGFEELNFQRLQILKNLLAYVCANLSLKWHL